MRIVARVGGVVGSISNESFIQNILVTMNPFNFGLLLKSKEDWSAQVRGEVADARLVSVLGKEFTSTSCKFCACVRIVIGQVRFILPFANLTNFVDVICSSVHLKFTIKLQRVIPIVKPSKSIKRNLILQHVSKHSITRLICHVQ